MHEFIEAGKPVLGICRGAQLINVALGGTLHQDIPSHRTDEYEKHRHDIRLEPGSGLARLYRGIAAPDGHLDPPPVDQGARPRPARRGVVGARWRDRGDPRQRQGLRLRRAVASRVPPPGRRERARQRADPGRIPAGGARRLMDLGFLPPLPPELSHAAIFGALVIVGLVAGEIMRRYASLPRITGYVLAGAAVGPQGLGLVTDNMLFDLRLLIDLSIGLIVFELGFRLDLKWLRMNRWLLVTAIAEALLAFWAIFGALIAFGYRPGARGDGRSDRHGDLAGDRDAGGARAARAGPGHRAPAPLHRGEHRVRLRAAYSPPALSSLRAQGDLAGGAAAPAVPPLGLAARRLAGVYADAAPGRMAGQERGAPVRAHGGDGGGHGGARACAEALGEPHAHHARRGGAQS